MEWHQQAGDAYHVTGVDTRGRRFKIVTTSWMHARGINVWNGSRWLVRDGRRTLIERVYN
jgi:hypothetical protein